MKTPLQEPTFLILTALARAPMHGYGLILEVSELSEGRLSLRPGTLYGSLDRLADEELVTVDRTEIVDGRARKYYRLTDQGSDLLRTETERMRRAVEAATTRLAGQRSSRRPVIGPSGGRLAGGVA
jgi:DNA-binding PadR family transcriptional regulator